MASTYVNDLRLNEMATGDQSGSWGTVTNTNLELIGEAFSYGTETIGDADSTLTIADGAADAARSFYLKITSSVDLTTTRIVTLAPNTVSKVWMIENATTGSQVITIKQGSGATINVPNGQVKMISTDGAGSGGAVLDLLVDVDLTGTTTLVNLDVSGAVDIAGDLTLSAGGDGALRFTAASSVKVLDNDAAALVFEEADNAYMTFVTTDGSEAVKFDKALDINAATQIDATVTVGVDDTGYDVKFFGATTGKSLLWDESADSLIVTGSTSLQGGLEVGIDDTGYDVKFFGATAGAYMLWDESADTLEVSGTVVADGLTVDGTSGYVRLQDLNAAVVSGTDMGGIEWRTGDSTVVGANRITARVRVEGSGTFNGADVAPSRMIFSTHAASGVNPVDRMKIDYDGDISFYEDTGTTEKLTWSAGTESLRFDSATLQAINGTDPFLSGNAYYDGSNWKYATSTDATNYYQTDRQHIWRNAASGTAGNNITWSESMRIDVSGNVGIGTSSPAAALEIASTTGLAGAIISTSAESDSELEFRNTFSGNHTWSIGQDYDNSSAFSIAYANASGASLSANSVLVINTSGNVGIGTSTPSSFYSAANNLVIGTGSGAHGLTIYSGSGDSGYIGFNDTVTNSMQGFIQYNHSGDYMAFAPNGSVKVRIDSSGNLLVGATAVGNGGKLYVNGSISLGTTTTGTQSSIAKDTTQQTASVSTSATTIYTDISSGMSSASAGYFIIYGTDNSSAGFMDVVIAKASGTPVVVSSSTVEGSPPARTYSVSSFALQLTMASGTFNVNLKATVIGHPF
jgi:hypothetical protein